jgi:hypothetical protein
MPWNASIAEGRLRIYLGDEGFVRIRKVGEAQWTLKSALAGDVWMVDGLQGDDTSALLDLALAEVEGLVDGETWLCSTDELMHLRADPRLIEAWALWKEAHLDWSWVDDNLQVQAP